MVGGDKTRQILIETAGRLFAKKGFQVTVREIVAEAGQCLGSVRYYFQNKDGLTEAVLEFASNGWKNHEDLIDFIIRQSASKFETSKGRREILKQVFDILFWIKNEEAKHPRWTLSFLVNVMLSATPPPCKQKYIQLVAEPNRRSLDRLIEAYCPGLSDVARCILNVNLFISPVMHYRATYNPVTPVPFLPEVESAPFYEEVKRTSFEIAWLTLEQKRKEIHANKSVRE